MPGIWDYMRPAVSDPNPTGVELTAERQLHLTWSDGVKTQVAVRTLRLECPCAGCVDEWTHQRTLNPASVADDISAKSVDQVGNYALSIHFTDGHETGIFSWKLLRELSEAPRPAG